MMVDWKEGKNRLEKDRRSHWNAEKKNAYKEKVLKNHRKQTKVIWWNEKRKPVDTLTNKPNNYEGKTEVRKEKSNRVK